MARVQIDKSLFISLWRLHCLGEEDNANLWKQAEQGLWEKARAIAAHERYTEVMRAKSTDERDEAWLKYLSTNQDMQYEREDHEQNR
jgi:hypothetical protein